MKNRRKVTRLVTLIKNRLNEEVVTTPGRLGQFEIIVDGNTIAARGGSLITQLLGGGYPDLENIVELIEKSRG